MTVKRVVEVGLEFGSLVDNRWLCGNYHALRDEEKKKKSEGGRARVEIRFCQQRARGEGCGGRCAGAWVQVVRFSSVC